MARIDLLVTQSLRAQPEDVLDSQGHRITIPFLRVFGLLQIGWRARYVADCIIDTAAHISVFPLLHWQHFARDIEWLTPVNLSSQSWVRNVYGRTGGHCRCRVGRVDVVAHDVLRRRPGLASVPVIALFEEVDSGDDRILIGVHASIVQRRYLHVDPDAAEGWIEDR
jgi:hypothetical protein